MKIKSVLISQPEPSNQRSPYHELAEKYGVDIYFRRFLEIKPVPAKELRKQRLDILKHTSVFFTSRTAIDHFFRIAEEMRVNVPDSMKYFCMRENIAHYLQKYIEYRKRKIFYVNTTADDLIELIKQKDKNGKLLLPVAEKHKMSLPKKLGKHNIDYTKAVMYKTEISDLSDLQAETYDLFVLFSPTGVQSLFKNFPNFSSKGIKIASFGQSTAKALKDNGISIDVEAPTPQVKSIITALDTYLSKSNGKNNGNA